MRLLLTLFISLSVSSASVAQENYVLTTKVDPQLKAILETVMGLVVGQLPSVNDQSQFVLNEGTNLQAGSILGDLSLQIDTATGTQFASQAQMSVELFSAENNGVLFVMTTTGAISADQLLEVLQGYNASLCPAGSTTGCAANLVNPEEAALPSSQKGAAALERFKSNLILSLNSSAAGKQTQTFGAPTEASGPFTAEVSQMLTSALQNGFVVNGAPGETTLVVDVLQFAQISPSVSVTLPAFGVMSALSGLEIKFTDAEATYALEAQAIVPANTIATYDAYLTREQNNPNGVAWMQDLIAQIGPWLVRNCSESDKTAWCLEQLINTCGKDIGMVEWCINGAKAAKCGKDLGACAGDIATGTGEAIGGAVNSAGNAINDALNGIFGGGEEKKPE